MDNIFISIFKYAVSFIEGLLAESIIVLLILGLLLFFAGLAAICILITTTITSNKVDGIVAGAVMVTKIKRKQRVGKLKKNVKSGYMLSLNILKRMDQNS